MSSDFVDDDYEVVDSQQRAAADAFSKAPPSAAAYYEQQEEAKEPEANGEATDELRPEDTRIASIVAHGILEYAAASAASTPARALTKKQRVVVKSIFVPFVWSSKQRPTTFTLDRAFMEKRFKDEGIDFSKGVYVRKLQAGHRSTTSPYTVAARVRGIDSSRPTEAIDTLMRPGDARGYTVLIARGQPQESTKELWTNSTDPTMVDQHGKFDYDTELKNLKPAPSARAAEHTERQCVESTALGALLVSNEHQITEGRGFNRYTYKDNATGIEEVVLMNVNTTRAKEVLDFYHKNYLGKLITTKFNGDVKVELVRPDHQDEEPAKMHVFADGDAGATPAAIAAAKVTQRAELELIVHLVKNTDDDFE